MKRTSLPAHNAPAPYLVQWVNVERGDERVATIEAAIARMVACGFEAVTYQDAYGNGFHRAAQFHPLNGWRYCNEAF